jgi:YfiH family protein
MTPRVNGEPVVVLREGGLAGMPGVVHGFSTRRGGVSAPPFASLNLGPRTGDAPGAVRANRRRLLAALGLDGWPVLAPRQVHGADVAVVRAGERAAAGGVVEGDGVVTDARGVALMVLAADCLPILLHAPTRGVIAAVHAGWRGTAGGIAGQAVAAVRAAFGVAPAELQVALGPAIGRCCYEVGAEVLAAVAAATPCPPGTLWEPLPGGKGMLDLGAANRAQLAVAGVPPDQIGALGECTACRTDRFFSHRREGGQTGRAAAVIALRPA